MAASVAMQLLLASPVTTSLTNRSRVVQFFPVKYVPGLRGKARVCIRCLAEDDEKKHLGSRKFSDVLLSGAVAERINGRLAIIGFVAAMAEELSKGQHLFTQIISDGGIPLLKGIKVESSSVGFFTADAELWNGRFAMLGFFALAFTEYLKGGTLV